MKRKRYISLGASLLLCGMAAAESWASSEEEIQKNLNQLIATKQCPSCNLRGAALTRMDLQGANLQGADLSNAKLSLTNLSKADLRNAVLRDAVLGGTDFAGADLRGVDFTGAQLAGAYLKEAILDDELIQDTPSEPEAQVMPGEGSQEETEELASAPVAGESVEPIEAEPVSSAVTTSMEVPEASVQEPPAVEENAEEVKAVSTSSGGQGGEQEKIADDGEVAENLVMESLDDLPKEEKKKPPVTLPDIDGGTATTIRPKELVPLEEVQQVETVPDAVQPEDEVIEGVEADVEMDEIPVIEAGTEQKEDQPKKAVKKGSGFWNKVTSLFDSEEQQGPEKKAGAEQAEQEGAYTVETFAQSQTRLRALIATLLEKRRCVACDLAGADLRGKDLEEVDLERADLSGAQLEGADLQAANLKGVNFIAANLKNADLRKADLYRADCTNADLTGTRLEGALLDSVDFTDAIGVQNLETLGEQ